MRSLGEGVHRQGGRGVHRQRGRDVRGRWPRPRK